MSIEASLTAFVGPVLGIFVVLFAYCLIVYIHLKCCKSGGALRQLNPSWYDPGSEHIGTSSLEIFVMPRPGHSPFSIPRPTVITSRSAVININQDDLACPNGAPPLYEGPPPYEDCIKTV